MEVNGQLHAPAPLALERFPATHYMGGWVDPRANML